MKKTDSSQIRLVSKLLVLVLAIASLYVIALGPQEQTTGHESSVHWTYAGDTGPEKWAELSADYELCAKGVSQSPIDISNTQQVNLEPIQFSYHESPIEMVNNGHTIQANVPSGSALTIKDQQYNLVQFHFHSPSEHTMSGVNPPMEVHFVHKSETGNQAVIGAMIQPQLNENTAFKSVIENMPLKIDKMKKIEQSIALSDLLPKSKKYISYSGSLTTPPCTEGVSWMFLREPIYLSQDQIAKYTALYPHNNRPVQKINDRILHESVR